MQCRNRCLTAVSSFFLSFFLSLSLSVSVCLFESLSVAHSCEDCVQLKQTPILDQSGPLAVPTNTTEEKKKAEEKRGPIEDDTNKRFVLSSGRDRGLFLDHPVSAMFVVMEMHVSRQPFITLLLEPQPPAWTVN